MFQMLKIRQFLVTDPAPTHQPLIIAMQSPRKRDTLWHPFNVTWIVGENETQVMRVLWTVREAAKHEMSNNHIHYAHLISKDYL